MRIKLGLFLCVVIIAVTTPGALFAQEISPSVKKKVVQNFQPKLSQFMPFGTSETCSLKPKGDANCDDLVNQFDLSVWQVEFNAADNPRRSDFNNDGIVNLLDYGIWKNTFYPAKPSAITYLFQKVADFLNLSVTAQEQSETASGGGEINSSNTITSGANNSLVINNNQNGTTQQTSFDANANPVNSQTYGDNSQVLSGVSFLNSGGTVVTTQEDGVLIQISQTAEGPILQFFRNPDGSLIASKSWPTAASYEAHDPPMSATLPGKTPNTFLTLNIQPNGNGILQEINGQGEVLTQTQILASGLYTSYDTRTNMQVQTLNQFGITILSMPNSLGGNTVYNFYKNGLFSITQSDKDSNTWVATLNTSQKWEMQNMKDSANTKKIVDNPVQELKSNTPNPDKIMQLWNYYSEGATASNPDVDFATSFNSQSRALTSQVKTADLAYDINQVPPESEVLGIIKEAYAQEKPPPNPDNPFNESGRTGNGQSVSAKVDSRADGGTVGGQTTVLSVVQTGPGGEVGNIQVVVPSTYIAPDLTGLSPAQAIDAIGTSLTTAGATPTGSIGRGLGDTALNSTSSTTLGDIRTSVAPAEPAPVNPAPVNPAPVNPAPVNPAPVDPAPARPSGGLPPPPPGSGLPAGTGAENAVTGNYHGITTTTTRNENGSWTTTGDGFAQVHDPATGSTWTDTDGGNKGVSVTTGPDGAVTSIKDPEGNVYTPDASKDYGIGVTTPSGEYRSATRDEASWVNSIEDQNAQNNPGVPESFPGTGGCFLAGTLISTPDGPVPIEKLKPGMKVYSYNEGTRQKEISDFGKLDINLVSEYLIINGVKVTTYHRIYVEEDGLRILKRADELKTGDFMINDDLNTEKVISVTRIKEKAVVYNLLSVVPNNNFFAGRYLVHNSYGEPAGPDEGVGDGEQPSDPGFSGDSFSDNNQGSVDQNSQSGGGGSGEANN